MHGVDVHLVLDEHGHPEGVVLLDHRAPAALLHADPLVGLVSDEDSDLPAALPRGGQPVHTHAGCGAWRSARGGARGAGWCREACCTRVRAVAPPRSDESPAVAHQPEELHGGGLRGEAPLPRLLV